MKIWDVTLDKGLRGTKSMLVLLFEITKPAFGSKLYSCKKTQRKSPTC